MADKVYLKKDGEVVAPVTTSDAVVDKTTGNSIDVVMLMNSAVVQETGTSDTLVMSQNAVTKELAAVEAKYNVPVAIETLSMSSSSSAIITALGGTTEYTKFVEALASNKVLQIRYTSHESPSSTLTYEETSTENKYNLYWDRNNKRYIMSITVDDSPTIGYFGNAQIYADVAVSGSFSDLTDTPVLDSTPTTSSSNAVTSGGVKSYVDTLVASNVASATEIAVLNAYQDAINATVIELSAKYDVIIGNSYLSDGGKTALISAKSAFGTAVDNLFSAIDDLIGGVTADTSVYAIANAAYLAALSNYTGYLDSSNVMATKSYADSLNLDGINMFKFEMVDGNLIVSAPTSTTIDFEIVNNNLIATWN